MKRNVLLLLLTFTLFTAFANVGNPGTSDFSVYPNPTTNFIYINGEVSGELIIANMIGNVVLEMNLEEGKRIDITHLPEGYYFIKLKGNDQSIKRLVIDR